MLVNGMNFGSIVIAGFVGGYAMVFVGYWMEGFLGLPKFDCSQDGVVYLGGEKPYRWIVGITFHLVDSILFAFPFAAWGHLYLPGPGYLRGLLYGVLLTIAVQLTIAVGSVGGGKHFRVIPQTPKAIGVDFFLTAIYGLFVGTLYLPGGG